MPYKVTAHVHHDGVALLPGAHVDDELGAAILAEHPGTCVRVNHDDDVCPADCASPLHARNAVAPKPAASYAAKSTEG